MDVTVPLNVYLLLLMFLQEIFIKIYTVSSIMVGTLESKISSMALFSWSRRVKEQIQYGGTGAVIEVHPGREVRGGVGGRRPGGLIGGRKVARGQIQVQGYLNSVLKKNQGNSGK